MVDRTARVEPVDAPVAPPPSGAASSSRAASSSGAAPSSGAGGGELTEFERAVVEVLARTGPGDVVTYGEVASEAGYPGAARAVGNVLKSVDDLPWWRVVTAAGRLVPHNAVEQARRLRAEGVTVVDGRVRAGS